MTNRDKLTKLSDNIGSVIVGKEQIIKLLITALLSEGHVLLEDMPGTGKTTFARALAASLGCDFKRIQFTPDLLPADISGLNVYDQKASEFKFIPGPVMTNILLADEINRATPRTQSALLEAMQEQQVSVDGKTYTLDNPFMVIATQNPIETAGTYPLPEAQMDRFLMQLSMGKLDASDEISMLKRFETSSPLDDVSPVLTKAEVLELREEVGKVFIHEDLMTYIVELINQMRADIRVLMPISPRGSLALMKAAKAYAYVSGRDYVLPDDIKALSVSVLAHRMLVHGIDSEREDVVKSALDKVTVPSEDFSRR